jgi:thermitase
MKDHRSTLSRILPLLVCVAFVALSLPGGGQPAEAQQIPSVPASPSPGETYAPDQLLLRFRPGVSRQRADEILAQRGLSRQRRIEALGVDVLRLPPALSVERAVAIYSRHPLVEFAEPNYVLQALEITDQWGLEKVRAEEAWDEFGTDPPSVVLATVDTGIDRNHPDLVDNIWTNADEIPGNGIDDDKPIPNGYVDDTWGWDFVNNDNDPMDDMMHGTAVSSVAAGAVNGSGVAGVCPWCQLMAVKVLDALGSGYLDTVAQGVTYAADNGAQVINLSLGATAGSDTLEQAVTYAWGKGAVVVAAAGNNGLEQLFYPAAYTHAMAVGSTNVEDYRSCFSNYSEGFITVTAPGEAILTAMPNGGYATHSGTSVAAPHVTGLAGLLFSKEPGFTNVQVRERIEQSAVDLGPDGLDGYFGWGRVDALRAVSGDISPTTPPQALFTDDPTATGYAHARKVARDGNGKLHWVWHTQEDGQYQVLYATSEDGGQTWTTPPEVVFSSSAETYHPALAVDDAHVYVAFPSKHGSATYRVFFASKALDSGTWPSLPDAVLGGAYDAVRPDLYVDTATDNLHLAAASLDNAPNVYYTWSDDDGANWQEPSIIPVDCDSRYADVYAHAGQITLAVRTVEFWFILIPRYHLRTFHSSDGGVSWQGSNDLATYDGILTGEYGFSLAGVGNELILAYEHAGNIKFGLSSDGLNWTLPPDPLGAGAWPTLTRAGDGQAWALWDRSSNIVMRHYTGSAWEAEEDLGTGTYPNLKAGIDGNLLEWVVTRCSAPYCMTFASRSLGDNDPPLASDVNGTVDEDPPAPAPWTPAANDPDGDTLACSVTSPPDNGTATVASDCSSGTYQPDADFSGTDTFAYQACDPGGLCDSGTVTYQVNPVPDPPLAGDVNGTVDEDPPAPVPWTPAANDPDGDTLTCSVKSPPDNGTATVASDCSSGTYQPDADFSSTDTFTYQACDPGGLCDSGTVTYDVSPVNDSPQADDVSDTTAEDTADTWYPSVGDVDGDTLTCSIASTPEFGIATVESDCSSGTYQPGAGFGGIDTFTYQACDPGGLCDSGTVTYDVTANVPLVVHIGDLDSERATNKNKWTAMVTITVHDADHGPVSDATVTGFWSNGATGSSECTTDADGICAVSQSGILKRVPSVDFTVSHVSHATLDYAAAENHDPDGDSDGTTITVYLEPPADQPPAVTITDPADGAAFASGATIGFAGTASDAEDGDVTASLAWSSDIDGQIDTGGSVAAVLSDGVHTITATATDSAGGSGSANISITVGTPPTMHVGDLAGVGETVRSKWQAIVTITVHDAVHGPVANATVSGAWSGGATGGAGCTTDGNGQCSVIKNNLKSNVSSVTFTVSSVAHSSFTYAPGDNHDPDGDSDGTRITVSRPN